MSVAGRILIVDDTLASLKLMSDTLKAESYEVYSTDSGELALGAARSKLPELILCDMRMPGMDGLEVCRRLKADPLTQDIPLMFISAATATEEKVDGFAAGAVDFVSKPFQRDELLARVRTHLELSRLRCQLEQRVALRTAELLDARNEARSYLDLVQVTIVSLDIEGRVRMLNREGKRLFGYDIDSDVIGRSWFTDFLAQPEGQETELAWFAAAVSGRAAVPDYAENTVVNRRGERRSMAWHNSVERDACGAITSILCAGEDITQRKANEAMRRELSEQLQDALASLEELNGQLEHRVQQRTSELESAHVKLRQTSGHLAQAERSASMVTVMSGVARELQVPIAGSVAMVSELAAQAQRMEMACAGGAAPSVGDWLAFLTQFQSATGALQRSLSQANQIIGEIEQLASARSGEQRKEFSLQSLVGEVLASQLRLFKTSHHQVLLQIEPGLVLESFPRALGQVLTNLLNNALTHAFVEGFNGEIRISAELRGADHVVLAVADNGIGIGSEVLPYVFDPFFTTRGGEGGRGLGLALAHATVQDVLGGSIAVANNDEGGARFTLALPRLAPVRERAHG